MNSKQTLTISELTLGQSAKVLGFGAMDVTLRQKLMGMGIHRGATLTLVRRAPLGDPLQIKVGQTSFSVRSSDIQELQIQAQV